MSAGTVPVALVEAIEEGRVKPGSSILLPASAPDSLVRALHPLGERVTPLGTTDVDLPPCGKTALEMVREQIRKRETTRIAH